MNNTIVDPMMMNQMSTPVEDRVPNLAVKLHTMQQTASAADPNTPMHLYQQHHNCHRASPASRASPLDAIAMYDGTSMSRRKSTFLSEYMICRFT